MFAWVFTPFRYWYMIVNNTIYPTKLDNKILSCNGFLNGVGKTLFHGQDS